MRNALLVFVLLTVATSRAHADPIAGKAILDKVVDATNDFFAHDVERLTHEMLVISR